MTNNVHHHPEYKFKRLIPGYFEIRQEIKGAQLFHTQDHASRQNLLYLDKLTAKVNRCLHNKYMLV